MIVQAIKYMNEMFISSLTAQISWIIVEEKLERWEEPEMMDGNKETVFFQTQEVSCVYELLVVLTAWTRSVQA